MAVFSSDADILKYEPVLFGELHLPGQVLASGNGGVLDGTSFTVSGADFASAGVSAGCVVYLQSSGGEPGPDGAYEIVSVESATEMIVSVVRVDSSNSAVAPPAGESIAYRICTFAPQANEVGLQLAEYFNIGQGEDQIDADDIVDKDALKRVSVFGVLSILYAMHGNRMDGEHFWQKSLHYKRLFEKAREGCRVDVDTDSDGLAEQTRIGGAGRLVRD
jgi:hypothetical protein